MVSLTKRGSTVPSYLMHLAAEPHCCCCFCCCASAICRRQRAHVSGRDSAAAPVRAPVQAHDEADRQHVSKVCILLVYVLLPCMIEPQHEGGARPSPQKNACKLFCACNRARKGDRNEGAAIYNRLVCLTFGLDNLCLHFSPFFVLFIVRVLGFRALHALRSRFRALFEPRFIVGCLLPLLGFDRGFDHLLGC